MNTRTSMRTWSRAFSNQAFFIPLDHTKFMPIALSPKFANYIMKVSLFALKIFLAIFFVFIKNYIFRVQVERKREKETTSVQMFKEAVSCKKMWGP